MTIAAVSATSSFTAPQPDPTRQAFVQLASAVQSGDLAAAQSAYAALTQANGGNPNNPSAPGLSQIGDALQAGDIGKAQQALPAVQQQMHARGAHHHHGHHHGGGDNPQTAATSSTTSTDATGMTPNTLVDVTA